MEIIITKTKIDQDTLKALCDAWFDDMVKVVIDVEREIIAIGGDLHADAELLLLEDGSLQRYLWGANIYPFLSAENRIEYTALINIRPQQDNSGMEVLDQKIKEKMNELIQKIVISSDETLV